MFLNEEYNKERLSTRVIKGGFWVFSLRVIHQLFMFVRVVILARILAPHDFGLMGIAMLTMASLETFSNTGFQAALIQKKENVKGFLDSAWTVLILRSIILFVILYFIAPYAAIFFKSPMATELIRIIGLAFFLRAFTNIGIVYFKKELEFNKQFIYQLSQILADFAVAVSAALLIKNVWALVFGLLAGNAVGCIMSYLIHPYRPHLHLNLRKAKELFAFGKWILASSVIIFLLNQGDDIFLGKILGVTILGFYQMAYRISNLVTTEISHTVAQVTFPAYSKLQDNINSLKKGFFQALQVTTFLSVPIAVGIIILGAEFTKVFLGEKWMPMVPAMQVLAVWGLLRSLGTPNVSLFRGIGKPQIDAHLQFVRLILLVILIYPLTQFFHMVGTSLAVLLSSLPIYLNQVSRVNKIIRSNFFLYCKQIAPSVINGSLMGLALLFLKTILSPVDLKSFVGLVLSSVILYGGVALILEKIGYGIRPHFEKLLIKSY